jgi:hypothetical protein
MTIIYVRQKINIVFKLVIYTVTCIPIASQRVGKYIPATKAHTMLERHPLLGDGLANMHFWQQKTAVSVGPVKSGYKKCVAGKQE